MNALGNFAQDMELSNTATVAATLASLGRDQTIHFPEGIFGFPECRSYALFRTAHPGLFWLQSTEHETLTLLLADPFVFVDGYTVELAESDARRLDAVAAADVAILVTVTIAESSEQPNTANLQGPIALNLKSGRARQVIVSDPTFGVRQPIDLTRGAT
jgi:flagellar assembly factor FliW